MGLASSWTKPTAAVAFVLFLAPTKLPSADAKAHQSTCTDQDPMCEHWSKIAECVANPYFMRQTCAKSCQVEPVCALRPVWPLEWPGYASEAGTRLYALQVGHTSPFSSLQPQHPSIFLSFQTMHHAASCHALHHWVIPAGCRREALHPFVSLRSKLLVMLSLRMHTHWLPSYCPDIWIARPDPG